MGEPKTVRNVQKGPKWIDEDKVKSGACAVASLTS